MKLHTEKDTRVKVFGGPCHGFDVVVFGRQPSTCLQRPRPKNLMESLRHTEAMSDGLPDGVAWKDPICFYERRVVSDGREKEAMVYVYRNTLHTKPREGGQIEIEEVVSATPRELFEWAKSTTSKLDIL